MLPSEYLVESHRTVAPETDNLEHYTVGLITEVGEIFDWFKKVRYYKKTPEVWLKAHQGKTMEDYQKFCEKFSTVNLMEEIGDCFWYLAGICRLLGFSWWYRKPAKFPRLTQDDDGFEGVHRYLLPDVNHLAVVIFSNMDTIEKGGIPAGLGPTVAKVWEIQAFLGALALLHGYSVEECMDRNIAKLRTRYPFQFSSVMAMERNLEAEKLALRGETK